MKKHHLPACLLAILLLLSCALPVCAVSASPDLPDPSSQFYVYDAVGVLGSAAETKIVSENHALFALSGAEIVVVCVDTTGSMDIADYAYELFNQWGIGSSQRNNGVLILLSIEEDDYWVLQGEGLEETLTSGMLKLMNNDYLEPHFAQKQYEDGVLALFEALVSHFETLYSIDIESWDGAPGEFTPRESDEGEMSNEGGGSSAFMSVVMIAIFILLVVIILNNRGGGGGGGGHRYYGSSVHIPIVVRPPRGGFFPGGSRPPHGGSFGGGFGGSRGGFSGGSFGGARGGFSGGSRGGFSGGGGGRSRGGGAGRR